MPQQLIKNKKTFWLLAAAVLLIFFHWTGLLSPVENLFLRVLSPLSGVFYRLGSGAGADYNDLTDRRDLRALLEEKEKENRELVTANAELNQLKAENWLLRQYQRFFNDQKYDYQLVNVVARDFIDQNQLTRSRLLISRGSANGLREGLPVVNQEGIIVGRLTGVKTNVAEVALITDRECRLATAIQNETEVLGIAEGEAGLTVKINFIQQTKTIAVDNIVVTSGLEASVPGGLVIGRVSQVNKESNELWQNAVVEPLAELDNLRILSVIMSPADNLQ